MIEIKKDWDSFKTEIASRALRPQFYVINRGGIDCYLLVACDDFIQFSCEFSIQSEDYTDFDSNYRNLWNKQLSFVDPTGISQFIPSSRPSGTTTFFTGKDDNNVTLDFNMTVEDASISRDLTFNESIYIKDGGMMFEGAPFGAYFNVEAVHPQAGIVAKFCRNIFILGTGSYELNSEDKSLLSQGLILRVTVFNSPTPTAFKAVGWLEGFRATMT